MIALVRLIYVQESMTVAVLIIFVEECIITLARSIYIEESMTVLFGWSMLRKARLVYVSESMTVVS